MPRGPYRHFDDEPRAEARHAPTPVAPDTASWLFTMLAVPSLPMPPSKIEGRTRTSPLTRIAYPEALIFVRCLIRQDEIGEHRAVAARRIVAGTEQRQSFARLMLAT